MKNLYTIKVAYSDKYSEDFYFEEIFKNNYKEALEYVYENKDRLLQTFVDRKSRKSNSVYSVHDKLSIHLLFDTGEDLYGLRYASAYGHYSECSYSGILDTFNISRNELNDRQTDLTTKYSYLIPTRFNMVMVHYLLSFESKFGSSYVDNRQEVLASGRTNIIVGDFEQETFEPRYERQMILNTVSTEIKEVKNEINIGVLEDIFEDEDIYKILQINRLFSLNQSLSNKTKGTKFFDFKHKMRDYSREEKYKLVDTFNEVSHVERSHTEITGFDVWYKYTFANLCHKLNLTFDELFNYLKQYPVLLLELVNNTVSTEQLASTTEKEFNEDTRNEVYKRAEEISDFAIEKKNEFESLSVNLSEIIFSIHKDKNELIKLATETTILTGLKHEASASLVKEISQDKELVYKMLDRMKEIYSAKHITNFAQYSDYVIEYTLEKLNYSLNDILSDFDLRDNLKLVEYFLKSNKENITLGEIALVSTKSTLTHGIKLLLISHIIYLIEKNEYYDDNIRFVLRNLGVQRLRKATYSTNLIKTLRKKLMEIKLGN